MKLANRSTLYVYAGVFSGSLPLTGAENRIKVTNQSGNLPPNGESFDAPAGIYWVMYNISSAPGAGQPPVGTLVGQTGGVRETDTVVLTEDFRIVVQA